MYNIPNVPSSGGDIHENADFIEIQCIRNQSVSAREIFSSIDKLEDPSYFDGVPEDESFDPKLVDTMDEIERRGIFCKSRYPFTVGADGHVVSFNPAVNETIRDIYTFLLFATRLNMKEQRIQNQIDGTLLFEELSEHVGKYYFGERTASFLFGTASREGNFEKKIGSLIKQLGEGGGFKNRNKTSPLINKDDDLDVVVWKPFADNYPGKLMGFGQCKTGTHWKNHLKISQPISFCSKWFTDMPPVPPVRLFFISESLLRNQWYEFTVEAGILFDRCRIMDYLPVAEIEESRSFLSQIKAWNKAVTEKFL